MKDLSKYKIVGRVTKEIGDLKDFDNLGDIYVAPGLLKHIQKHVTEFSNMEKEDLCSLMEKVCSNPQYVGSHPQKEKISLELVKKIDNNILVAIEIDKDNGYNYVSSMYSITDGKLENRINSSRLIKFNKDILEEVATTVEENSDKSKESGR